MYLIAVVPAEQHEEGEWIKEGVCLQEVHHGQ